MGLGVRPKSSYPNDLRRMFLGLDAHDNILMLYHLHCTGHDTDGHDLIQNQTCNCVGLGVGSDAHDPYAKIQMFFSSTSMVSNTHIASKHLRLMVVGFQRTSSNPKTQLLYTCAWAFYKYVMQKSSSQSFA